jgi:hypothetical protein
MNGVTDWLADRVALLLDPDEREAVRGDLAESGESGPQAIVGMAGLVARRQAALLWELRPWLALAVAMWAGLILTRQAGRWSHQSATYLWMYLANWRMSDVGNTGFWRLMAQEIGHLLVGCSLLMAGSLAAGIPMGMSQARRNTWVTGALFCGVLAVANLARIPLKPVFAPPILWAIYALLMQPDSCCSRRSVACASAETSGHMFGTI